MSIPEIGRGGAGYAAIGKGRVSSRGGCRNGALGGAGRSLAFRKSAKLGRRDFDVGMNP